MATKVTFNAKKFIKNFDKYNPKSLRNAVYLTAEELGYFIARGGSTNDPSKKGLPYNFQKGKNKFRQPVDLTKDSVLYKPRKNEVDFYLYNKEKKSNAPSKYLYPVIGGGSANDPSKKGLPYNFQQGKNKFRNPVDFTKNSVLYKPQKNKVDFYLYIKEPKGNALQNIYIQLLVAVLPNHIQPDLFNILEIKIT